MRGKTPEDRSLIELLDPAAEAAGYEIIRLSRAISEVLDAADPIKGEYLLEVSTPGIDRPLTRLEDFVRFEGYEVRFELDRLADGRKRFRGQLAGIEDGNIGVNLEDEADVTVYVPFGWITDAKLVLTDDLLKRGADERVARLAAETELSSEDEE